MVYADTAENYEDADIIFGISRYDSVLLYEGGELLKEWKKP